MKNIYNTRNARMNSRLMEKWGFRLDETGKDDDGESEGDKGKDEKDPEAEDYTDEGDREGDESETHPGEKDDTTKKGDKIKTGKTKGEKAYKFPSKGEDSKTHKGEKDFTTKKGGEIKTGKTKGEKAFEYPSKGEKSVTHSGTDFSWSTKHAKTAVHEALKREGMNEEQIEALMRTLNEAWDGDVNHPESPLMDSGRGIPEHGYNTPSEWNRLGYTDTGWKGRGTGPKWIKRGEERRSIVSRVGQEDMHGNSATKKGGHLKHPDVEGEKPFSTHEPEMGDETKVPQADDLYENKKMVSSGDLLEMIRNQLKQMVTPGKKINEATNVAAGASSIGSESLLSDAVRQVLVDGGHYSEENPLSVSAIFDSQDGAVLIKLRDMGLDPRGIKSSMTYARRMIGGGHFQGRSQERFELVPADVKEGPSAGEKGLYLK